MEKSIVEYDIAGLAEELEFDIKDLSVLFVKYIKEMKENIITMEKYTADKDWTMLERVVHNIKGVSINLNITDVHEEAASIDQLLKKGEVSGMDLKIKDLVSLINNSETAIKNTFLKMGVSL